MSKTSNNIQDQFDNFLLTSLRVRGKRASIIRQWQDKIKGLAQDTKGRLSAYNPKAIFIEDFDDALAGYDYNGRAVYFIDQIILLLMNRDGMNEGEANDFFKENIAKKNMGDKTPIYIWE